MVATFLRSSFRRVQWAAHNLGNRAALAAAVALLAACDRSSPGAADSAESTGAPTALVRGSLNYSERIALTDRAVAEITLEDVSRQDAPAEVLAFQRITNPGQVPIRYELPFEPDEIDPRLAYAVRARISDRGRLMFISDTQTPVLTRGAGRVANLMLTAVPEPSTDSLPLRGMFRYFADAAQFRDCDTDEVYAVAMEGAYIDLERAYLNSEIEPAAELLVELQGRYQERPEMEGNKNKINLIVDKLDKVLPQKSCASDQASDK